MADSTALALPEGKQGEEEEEEVVKPLTLKQAQFIATLKESQSLVEAYGKSGVHPNTHYRWKGTSLAYRNALNNLASEVVDLARHQLDLLMVKAADMIDGALTASEVVDCPLCKQTLICQNCEGMVTLQNWNATLKAADMILKRKGEFVHRTEVSGTIKHEHETLNHEERIAIALYAAGKEIPPALEASLRSKNALPERRDTSPSEEGMRQNVTLEEEVEGEFTDATTPSQENPESPTE